TSPVSSPSHFSSTFFTKYLMCNRIYSWYLGNTFLQARYLLQVILDPHFSPNISCVTESIFDKPTSPVSSLSHFSSIFFTKHFLCRHQIQLLLVLNFYCSNINTATRASTMPNKHIKNVHILFKFIITSLSFKKKKKEKKKKQFKT
ncbi:hypothetical protein BpHYR1_040966, partial [Brachionus plicatilis]